MIEESLFTAGAVEVTLSHAVPRAPGKYLLAADDVG